jgi:hypothetical protein
MVFFSGNSNFGLNTLFFWPGIGNSAHFSFGLGGKTPMIAILYSLHDRVEK